MNKYIVGFLFTGVFFGLSNYYGSTTAPVTIAGGIIKARHIDEVSVKYKRKDCPVCKGKGWYMSGDDIKKIECNYCEPDSEAISIQKNEPICRDGKCNTRVYKK